MEEEAEEAEAEEKNQTKTICLPSFEGEIYRFLFNFNRLIILYKFLPKKLNTFIFFSQLTISFLFKELCISYKFRFFYINIQNILLNFNRLILIFLDF